MEDKIGERRPMNRSDTEIIVSQIGFGAMILDLHLTDYSRGSMRSGERTRCFWLTDGRRVDISMGMDGGVIASVTHEPDPNIPKPLAGG